MPVAIDVRNAFSPVLGFLMRAIGSPRRIVAPASAPRTRMFPVDM